MIDEYDVIIIGGGCSGLSLAIHIAKQEPHKKILILESRREYQYDKIWSFWDVEAHPYKNQIQHRWSHWQIQYQGCRLIQSSSLYPYCSIPSNRFYTDAIKEIHQLPQITLHMDSPVCHIQESPSYVSVQTKKTIYQCSKVFDSRPDQAKPYLYQHFLGWHILSERPIFDPKTITLMDFDVDQSKGLHFMYLLPFSTHEALLESTFITPHIHEEQIYENSISNYLTTRFKNPNYQIIRKERGVIPLRTTFPKQNSNKLIPIGAKAGWMRASTGYAFLAIQKAIKKLAFNQQNPPFFNTDLWLDRIFLNFLHDNLQEAPQVFFDLFRKNAPERLIRFLTGNWSTLDLLQVLFSMPKIPMLKQALRLMTKRGL